MKGHWKISSRRNSRPVKTCEIFSVFSAFSDLEFLRFQRILAKMAALIQGRIDDVVKKHSIFATQTIDYIKNKYSSSNKNINQNDISTIQGFIGQMDRLMENLSNIALVSSSITEQVQDMINNANLNRPTFAQVVKEKESFDKFVQRKQIETCQREGEFWQVCST